MLFNLKVYSLLNLAIAGFNKFIIYYRYNTCNSKYQQQTHRIVQLFSLYFEVNWIYILIILIFSINNCQYAVAKPLDKPTAKHIVPNLPTQPDSLQVAIVAPFSGDYSDYGKQLFNAASQALVDYSKQLSPILDISPIDDGCNPETAIKIATNLVMEPKIIAVITHTCAANNQIANQIYRKHGLLQLIPMVADENITAEAASNTFKINGSNVLQSISIRNFIAKNFNNKKIAILHVDDPHNYQLAALLQEHLATVKLYPTLYQSINTQTFAHPVKLRTILKKLKKLKIDLIFFNGFYKETALLINAMDSSKIKLPLITADNIATPGFNKVLTNPAVASGTIMSFPSLPISTKNLKFKGQYLFGYAAMEIIIQTIIANYTANFNHNIFSKDYLANWLHQNQVNTILGKKYWDTNGEINDPKFDLYMLDNNGNYLKS